MGRIWWGMQWRHEISMFSQSWLPGNFVILTFQSETPEINLALCFNIIYSFDAYWRPTMRQDVKGAAIALSITLVFKFFLMSTYGLTLHRKIMLTKLVTQESLEHHMFINWRILILRPYLREIKDHCYGKMCPSWHFSN